MADYAFRTIEDRKKVQALWEAGKTPREMANELGKSLTVIYMEMQRGRDGTRMPDQRLRYSADLAQRRVQASLERRGKRTEHPADSDKAAETAGRYEDTGDMDANHA